MEKYRTDKSEILERSYQMVRNGLTVKYGSFDGVPQTGNQPLENKTDQIILEKLIFNKTFAILPFMYDDRYMQSVYTIGCWYYWRTPEIVLRFKEHIECEPELIHVIISRIHEKLYNLHKDAIDQKVSNTFDRSTTITIDPYNVSLTLTLIDSDNLIDIHTPYMFWFYTFWDHIDPSDNREATNIYPVYLIEIDRPTIDHLTNMFIGNQIDRFETVASYSKNNISDDFELSSDTDN